MRNKRGRQTLALDEPTKESWGDDGGVGEAAEAEDEREVAELEAEVKQMAERVQDLRRTVPSRLADSLSSQLAAQRPRLPVEVEAGSPDRSSQVGIATAHHEGTSEKSEMSDRTSLPEANQEVHERLRMFRAKITSNIDAMPNILKRINGCIARLKRADQNGIVVHSVFKKRRKI